MSVQAMAWVIEKSEHGGSALLVLMMMANHTYTDGTGGRATIGQIAAEARIAERTVRWIVQEKLIPSGELVVHRWTRSLTPGEPRHTFELPGVIRDGFHTRGVPQSTGRGLPGLTGNALPGSTGKDCRLQPASQPAIAIAADKESESLFRKSTTKNPPSPPAPQKPAPQGGTQLIEMHFPAYSQTVRIKAAKGRRLCTVTEKESMRGARAEDWLAFFQRKGFEAEIVPYATAQATEGGR